jgi:C4-dicarboxylate-specific signal transduction histidine kinase
MLLSNLHKKYQLKDNMFLAMINSLLKRVEIKDNEIKRLRQELEETNNLLIQQSKMAEVGKMISSITHQLKQPLQVIKISSFNLEMGKMFNASKEEIEHLTDELMSTVETQSNFMGQTIEDFKEFLTPNQNQSDFYPIQSAEQIKYMFNYIFEQNNININITEKQNFTIFGYENELKQVFLNIFSNAKDELVKNKTKNRAIDVDFFIENDKKVITISDNGGGIPQELLPNKLFDSYITTKGKDGTGLGLNICKKIVENRLNGDISVKNNSYGASFRLEFPL